MRSSYPSVIFLSLGFGLYGSGIELFSGMDTESIFTVLDTVCFVSDDRSHHYDETILTTPIPHRDFEGHQLRGLVCNFLDLMAIEWLLQIPKTYSTPLLGVQQPRQDLRTKNHIEPWLNAEALHHQSATTQSADRKRYRQSGRCTDHDDGKQQHRQDHKEENVIYHNGGRGVERKVLGARGLCTDSRLSRLIGLQ